MKKSQTIQRLSRRLCAAVVTVTALVSHSVFATDGTWNTNALGNWSDATKWLNSIIADGQGSTANLTFNISGGRTITINATSRTVGILNLGDSDTSHAYTLAASGGAGLIMDNGGSSAQINEVSTSFGDTISAPILLNGSLDFNNATAAKTLTISGGITANSAGLKTISNVSSAAGQVKITGVIGDGSGQVAVSQNSSASTLNLTGANTFTGGVTINSGTLTVTPAIADVAGTSSALGASGNITFAGGTLKYANANAADYSARFKSTGGNAIILDANVATTLGGGIDSSNTGGLTLVGGNGAITLNGVNSYSGGTILNLAAAANTLNIGNASALGNGTLTIQVGTIDNTSGADIMLPNAVAMNGSFSFVGSHNLTITSTATLGAAVGTTRTITVNGGVLTINGNFGDGTTATAISKNGAGTLVLSGNNTFSGGFGSTGGILNGILSINSFAALGTSSAAIPFGGTGTTGQLTYTGTGETSTRQIKLFNNVGSGATIDQSGTGLLKFSATSIANAGSAGTDQRRTLTLQGSTAGTGEIGGIIADATLGTAGQTALSLIKNGTGLWTLSGTNTYTGNSIVNGGALEAIDGVGLPTASILQLRGGVFQSRGTFTRTVTTSAGGVNWSTSSGGFAAQGGVLNLQLNGGTANLTWNGSSFVSTGQALIFGSSSADNLVDLQNGVNLGSSGTNTRTITVLDNPNSATDRARISGVITNFAAGQSLLKDGAGVLELTAANTYSGATILNAGTLALSGAGSLALESGLQILAGATFQVTNANSTVGGVVTNAGSIQVFNSGLSYAGNVVLNSGSSYLSLSGTNTFNNGLTINSGVNLSVDAASLMTVLGNYQNLGSSVFSNRYTVASGSRYRSSGGATNQFAGGLTISSGGEFDVTNGVSVVGGTITNAGTMTVFNAQAVYNGNVVNQGAYVSDPSTNTFNGNFTVGPTGTVVAAAGDVYAFGSNFVMQSTNRNFNMSSAQVVFASSTYGITTGTTNHILDLTGSGALDKGSNWLNIAQLATNFSLGTLSVSLGNSLQVTGGVANALYVGTLDVGGLGTNQLGSILDLDVNLYYDEHLAGNAYLGGQTYQFAGWQGFLIPIPEPSTLAVASAGLAFLAFLRRKVG